MIFEWEEIKNLHCCKTYRAKVFGGWVINNLSSVSDEKNRPYLLAESMTFIPDPLHQWSIE